MGPAAPRGRVRSARRVRALAAATAAAVLFAACGPVEDVAPDGEEQEQTAPLTGLALDEPEAAGRPVVAVKIDNHPAARPQVGLEPADVVFVELVEAGLNRFVALYHSTDAGDVGPVRSGREADADLLPPFEPVFAISGAAGPVLALFDDVGLRRTTEGDTGWFRVDDRAAPHDLFVSVREQWAAGEDLPAPAQPWEIDSETAPGGQDVAGLEGDYSDVSSVGWEWTGDAWVRSQDGEAHLTDAGDPVTAANVVVARVGVAPGPRGAGTVDIELVGEGDALVLRDGQAHHVTWRRNSPTAHFRWLDADDQPVALAPGRTWVELVPDTETVSLRPAEDEPPGR